MVIYKFENKINGKVYIGQTVQKLSKRISSHKYPGSNKNLPIDAAIKKYGIFSLFIYSTISFITFLCSSLLS